MPLHWTKNLEIGDPVVDSEHRYLVQLINNLNEQYTSGRAETCLTQVFNHLVNYVRVHFDNEEALMEAINYPGLQQHKMKHKELMTQAMGLSDQYLENENTITAETVAFLEKWAVEHIAEADMKIKDFLKGEKPPSLTTTPAYLGQSGSEFKKCTLCGKVWQTLEDLQNDQDKVVKGVQADMTNHLYNLILFDCSCGTTLALMIKELLVNTQIPFEIEEHDKTEKQPEYCLKRKGGERCLEKCVCKYTNQVLVSLG